MFFELVTRAITVRWIIERLVIELINVLDRTQGHRKERFKANLFKAIQHGIRFAAVLPVSTFHCETAKYFEMNLKTNNLMNERKNLTCIAEW